MGTTPHFWLSNALNMGVAPTTLWEMVDKYDIVCYTVSTVREELETKEREMLENMQEQARDGQQVVRRIVLSTTCVTLRVDGMALKSEKRENAPGHGIYDLNAEEWAEVPEHAEGKLYYELASDWDHYYWNLKNAGVEFEETAPHKLTLRW